MKEKKCFIYTQVNLQIDVPSRGPSPIPQEIIKGHEIVLNLPKPLTLEEKKYLLAVERGDLANVRRYTGCINAFNVCTII